MLCASVVSVTLCCSAVFELLHADHMSLAHVVTRLSTSARRRWDEDRAPEEKTIGQGMDTNDVVTVKVGYEVAICPRVK